MRPLRILVVDDSVVARRLLQQVLEREPGLEPVAFAPNGRVAMGKLTTLDVDAVVLDVEMPIMNGLETLSAIRERYPDLPVFMFSSLTQDGAKTTVEALVRGATDCVVKPTNTRHRDDALRQIGDTLIPKLKALYGRKVAAGAPPRLKPQSAALAPSAPRKKRPSLKKLPRSRTPIAIGIGASTGGPNALAQLIGDLGRRFSLPIAITQHMPPLFTSMLAQRLDKITDLSVREAKSGDVLGPGSVLIAPGDCHLTFVRRRQNVVAQLSHDPPENSCRPSVDVMFRSLADCYGSSLVTVVLTGMGSDGAAGVRLVRESGGICIAQDQATSTVWGMPGAVVQAGLAHQELPLDEIGSALRGMTLARSRPRSSPVKAVAGGGRR